jgi:AbrB family looped-hinge helix DNA binding protein
MHIEHVKLGDDGRIVIPAAARRDLGLLPGQTLVVESDGDSLLVRTADAALRETQDYFQQFLPPGVGLVDDLIADRRAEAAAEAAEADRSPRG